MSAIFPGVQARSFVLALALALGCSGSQSPEHDRVLALVEAHNALGRAISRRSREVDLRVRDAALQRIASCPPAPRDANERCRQTAVDDALDAHRDELTQAGVLAQAHKEVAALVRAAAACREQGDTGCYEQQVAAAERAYERLAREATRP